MKDVFDKDDTLLLESDLIYDKAVLQELIASPAANAAVLSPFESWMDGTCCLLDGTGHITGMVGKKDFRYEDAGSYYKTVNIWKFSRDFIKSVYLPFLSSYMSAYGRNEYYETVLKIVASNDPSALGSLVISGDRWYEVDDIEDLSVAEKRFSPAGDRYALIVREEGGSWRFPGLADFTVNSNPFFPPERLLSELRYGLADCITRKPSASGELDILAAKLLGADESQVCVLSDEGTISAGAAPIDASYADFSDLTGQEGETQLYLVDFGKRFGVPGLRIRVLYASAPEMLRSYKDRGHLSSPEEYFMQIVGKYKKDYAAAYTAFTEECDRMEKVLGDVKGVQAERTDFNCFTVRLDAYPRADDVRLLAARLLDEHKILAGSLDKGAGLSLFVRDRKSNDRLISALSALSQPEKKA